MASNVDMAAAATFVFDWLKPAQSSIFEIVAANRSRTDWAKPRKHDSSAGLLICLRRSSINVKAFESMAPDDARTSLAKT
eukprot:7854451-Alexandrium_andersonii.AAC.1